MKDFGDKIFIENGRGPYPDSVEKEEKRLLELIAGAEPQNDYERAILDDIKNKSDGIPEVPHS